MASHWSEYVEAEGPDGAYLPWKRVEPRVGISRTTAWRLQKTGDFPRPYVVSPGRVAYREREVEAWKASRGHRGPSLGVPRPGVAPRDAPSADASPSRPPRPPPSGEPAAALPESPPAPGLPPPRALVRPALRVRVAKPRSDQMTFDF